MTIQLEHKIIKTVNMLTRTHGRVWPWMVEIYLEPYRSTRTLRRDMGRLAAAGKLQRLGQRKGYVPAAARAM